MNIYFKTKLYFDFRVTISRRVGQRVVSIMNFLSLCGHGWRARNDFKFNDVVYL